MKFMKRETTTPKAHIFKIFYYSEKYSHTKAMSLKTGQMKYGKYIIASVFI